MEREIQMYSPHPNGRLFSRFTHQHDIKVGADKILAELNTYACYNSLRWVIETDIQEGTSQPIQGLFINATHLTIKTNCVKEINEGDIIFLQSPSLWPKGKYFIVDDKVKIDLISVPKQKKLFQHIPLRSLL